MCIRDSSIPVVLVEEEEHQPGPAKKEKQWLGLDLNMQGVFLHVLADCLGSVVVIISTAIVWQVLREKIHHISGKRANKHKLMLVTMTLDRRYLLK